MPTRQLAFNDFPEVLAEVDRLHQQGWQKKTGQWDLAQTLNHLTYFMKGSLDGHPYHVPWLFKFLFGRMVLRGILKNKRMKDNAPTPQKPLPTPGGDEKTAIADFKETIQRFQAHQGELHASPFFGYLTPQQWRELHLIHCGHHLGNLSPK